MRKLISLACLSVFLFATCKKGDDAPAEVIPAAPSNLNRTVISLSQVNLSWTDNSTNESGFKIERKSSNGNFQMIGTVTANTTSYADNAGLQAGTVYAYRVNAFNSAGNSLSYSNEATIGYPQITSNGITQITSSSARYSVVINGGGANMTAYGVVWSTSPNPTVNLSTKKENNGGSYFGGLINIDALTFNTTYYVRAYGTNMFGTAYGIEESFKTIDPAQTVAGGNGQGSAANQLLSATNVFVDATGNVFIADGGNHRIQKWTPGATTGITVAGGNGQGSGSNQLSVPAGIVVDATGNIFIADRNNHRIQKWAPGATSGTTVAGGNGEGAAANQLNTPIGIAIDASGNIFIADRGNHRIQKWTPGATSGTTVLGGNGQGSAPNQLASPEDVGVDGTGNIYAADTGNHRVQKWSNGYNQISTIAGGSGRGSGIVQLANPRGIFVNKSGIVFVSDTDNNRVMVWGDAGVLNLPAAGGNGLGSAVNQLSVPHGLFVDSAGFIYVADTGNHRIQKWGQ